MNQKRFDQLVQLAAALGVLILIGYMVSRGEISSEAVMAVISIILAGFGFAAGKRVEYQRGR